MSNATKAPRKIAVPEVKSTEMIPASCELPGDVHAKVMAAVQAFQDENGIKISFAAQLRKIVCEWAARQPAAAKR